MGGSLSLQAVATLLAGHRDVLDARPAEGEVPAALRDRGWAPYLLALDEASLDLLEANGARAEWPGAAAPGSLIELTRAVRRACDVARMEAPDASPARRLENPRKQAQIDAFARVVVPLAATAERVVDVGSGHGHLTRALADRLGQRVIGLERDGALVDRARAIAKDGDASFERTDVLATGLALAPGDCVVGLHACGELGDAMVERASAVGASIALVGCCLQKRRPASRTPLALSDPALALPRSILGLSNLTARDDAVETSRAENLRARERRIALHRLLTEHGVELSLGAEIEGLNRRAAHAELEVLVARAFALRRLTPPSPAAIADAARWAAMHHARMRRLALPRSLLGRVLEVFVLLDRAAYLEARGYDVTVAQLFPIEVSARNLVLSGIMRA